MADVQQQFDAALARVSELGSHNQDARACFTAILREARAAAAQPDLMARLLHLATNFAHSEGGLVARGNAADVVDVAYTEGFRALREHPSHAGVVAGAFALLSCVGQAMSRGHAAALLREAVQTLACDASDARADYDVALHAVVALNNVVANQRPNKESAITLGAVAALATAMTRHAGKEKLQAQVCAALHALGYGRMMPDAERALDAVLAALRAFPEDVELQKNGCLALSSLMHANGVVQAHCVRAGGLQLLAAALRRHLGVSEVCEAACLAMTNINMRNLAPEHESETLAALHSVVAAVFAHTEHAPTQEFGIHALGDLCQRREVARHAASSRVFTAVVDGMGAHPKNVCVQTTGCLALLSICHHGQPLNRAAAVTAGAIPALVRAMRTSYSRTALRSGAADFDSRYAAPPTEGAGPKMYAISALASLYRQSPDPNAPPAELLSGVPALHEGVMAVLHRLDCADSPALEKTRMDLVKCFTCSAILHASTCPDCPDCDALRARGELCGLKTCFLSTRAAAAGEAPVLSAGSMKVCSRCKTVAYCSVEHQHEDWKAHKPACKALCRRRAADEAAAAAAR